MGFIQDPAERAAREQSLLQQFQRYGVDPTAGMDQAIGVLDNFRIPGTNIGFEIGGGERGDSLARGLDFAGNWSKTAPGIGNVTRTAAALFDADAGGLKTLGNDLQQTTELQTRKRMANANKRQRQAAIDEAYTLLQYDSRNAQVPDVIPSGPLAGQAIPEGAAFVRWPAAVERPSGLYGISPYADAAAQRRPHNGRRCGGLGAGERP